MLQHTIFEQYPMNRLFTCQGGRNERCYHLSPLPLTACARPWHRVFQRSITVSPCASRLFLTPHLSSEDFLRVMMLFSVGHKDELKYSSKTFVKTCVRFDNLSDMLGFASPI